MRKGFFAGLSLVLAGTMACAVDSDSQMRGSCKLSCSAPKVAAGEYEIVPLAAEDNTEVELFCSAAFKTENKKILPYNKPLQVKYYIYELVPAFGKQSVDPREDPPGQAANNANTVPPLVERVPKSGIGFEPLLFGAMATENTNSSLLNQGRDTVSSGKFDGVVTPPEEWCSDTCGIMTYEFWPVCIEGADNQVVASLAAGGALLKKAWKFTISNSGTAP